MIGFIEADSVESVIEMLHLEFEKEVKLDETVIWSFYRHPHLPGISIDLKKITDISSEKEFITSAKIRFTVD